MRHNIRLLSLVISVALATSCGESREPETAPAGGASVEKSTHAMGHDQRNADSVEQTGKKSETPPEPALNRPSTVKASFSGTDNRVQGPWIQVASEDAWQAGLADKVQMVMREEGQGEVVNVGDLVTVHYHGLIFNGGKRGEVFDSSRERGQSISFPIGKGKLIPGWDKVIPGFKVGSKLTLMIPPSLAYGDRDTGKIKPGSTLLFEIDILSKTSAPEVPNFPIINDNDPRLKKLPSGLQILLLREGKGEKPRAQSQVRVHYAGWLIDGKPFDSSYERGDPLEFPVGTGQVIPGWDQGIMALNKGSKAILKIPPDLAYGPQGTGPIPPNATLIFQVELLE